MVGVEIRLRVIGEDSVAIAAPVARSGYHLWPSNLRKKSRTPTSHGLSSNEAGGDTSSCLEVSYPLRCKPGASRRQDTLLQAVPRVTFFVNTLRGIKYTENIPKIWKQLNADLIILTNINFVLDFSQILSNIKLYLKSPV